ncbi:thioredoxin [Kytococcus sp. CUA-901]|nr:thioredoxin [Kytococcus sp. CUA-901]
MAGTETTTDATFDQDVLKSELPVLVDFWADWCGPCKRVAPILEEIAKDSEGKLRIVKLNTDENPQTAARFGITSIPTMHVFFQGDVAKTIIGAQPKPKLLKELEPFLG